MKRRDVNTANRVRALLQPLARLVDGLLPKGAHFTLLVWTDDHEGRGAHYVSNAERQSVVKAMRETADRLAGTPGAPGEESLN